MARLENIDMNIDMQIKAVELLNHSLTLPANSNTSITNYNFNVSIESRADPAKKLVFVIVHIDIETDNLSVLLGNLSVSCIFEIINFEDIIKVEADGKVNIPQQLIETLNMISISTSRGVMFSTFKGTFLHNAVLPLIDPKQFQMEIQ
jgi:hypothetical protein